MRQVRASAEQGSHADASFAASKERRGIAENMGTDAPRPPAIAVRSVRLVYESTVLFDNFSFDVAGGLTTCLLGPSGVGKTSLLRLVAGLPGTGGAGRILCADSRPAAGRVAYMAQSDLLLPWLSAIDNVMLGPRLRGERGRRDAARALLAEVGLSGAEALRPAALSGGMRQRVALARTLFEDRPIVLMDEPFAALDAITRTRLQDLAVAKLGGRTVLLVTHDPLEAIRIADRVAVMAGRPAHIVEALEPPGAPPRDPSLPALAALYGRLMRALTAAASADGGGA